MPQPTIVRGEADGATYEEWGGLRCRPGVRDARGLRWHLEGGDRDGPMIGLHLRDATGFLWGWDQAQPSAKDDLRRRQVQKRAGLLIAADAALREAGADFADSREDAVAYALEWRSAHVGG